MLPLRRCRIFQARLPKRCSIGQPLTQPRTLPLQQLCKSRGLSSTSQRDTQSQSHDQKLSTFVDYHPLPRQFDIDGKIFVVTGGGRGLGLTLAEALVEAGGKVFCLDRLSSPSDEFHALAQRVANKECPGSLNYDHIDVRDAADVEHVISKIANEHSRMDGLIAAAGIQNVTPALDYPPKAIMEMMEINFKGVYCSAVSCARAMIKHKTPGSIIIIASMSGLIANKGFTASVYNSSKAACCQLTRSLAMEWGKVVDGKPIRVNALCPGNIITPMVKKNFEDDPELRATWERENMLGRMSLPHEYKGAALFLLSDASSFMTGSQLIIDGGYTAW